MNRYGKGAAFERAIAQALRSKGIWVVRSAGSKGPADLVAWCGGRKALIQCKAGGGISPLEVQALRAAARALGGTAWVVSKSPRGSESWSLVYPETMQGLVSTRGQVLAWLEGEASLPWD